MEIQVLRLSEALLPEVAHMAVTLWPESSLDEEYAHYRALLRSPKEKVLIARLGDHPAGFIHLCLRTDHVEGTATSPVLYVEGVFVRPEYRRKGVARSLVDAGMNWGKENHCTEMASDAEPANSGSLAFHRAMGFTEVNRVVCFRRSLDGPDY